MRRLNLLFCISFLLLLTACQNVQKNSKVIARAFNTSTHFQQYLMDKHAPEQVIVHHNIQYQVQPKLNLDLYQPNNIQQLSQRPTVVWIHGGGWIAGAKDHARGYFKLLAAQGYNVVSIEYQFAPQATYPTQLDQINHALQFISLNAKKYHIDAKQLFLAGDSAGANLASHYAALLTNPEFARASMFTPSIQQSQLKGLILHCGIYDLSTFISTAPNEIKLIEWGINNLVQAYTGNQKDNPEYLKQLSPAQHLTANYPPVFISGGNKDFLTDTQALPFVKALQEKKIPVQAVFYPDSKEWLIHEYQFFLGQKASQQTFQQTLVFLENNTHLQK
ncbi:MAG: Acetyl esterase [Acinetobacter bereziniae]|uniref:Acetyl esterase n=1 Tax=Acinetobacter bereziniae TaxID=106648 RepID=A0A833PEZ6_ACIBZ|nr:MAG: Acetyl esterase [Acinetobacter bereziniae]